MKKLKNKLIHVLKHCLRFSGKCKYVLFHKFYRALKNVNYENAEAQISKEYKPQNKKTQYSEPFKYEPTLGLSIIVPVYNVEKFLPRCIESLLQKTTFSYEVILVDDGSPDGCPKICDEYAKKDDRIRVIHQENHGVSFSRNVGIVNSRGKYILFVDSDDYLLENAFSDIDLANLDYDIIQFRHEFACDGQVFNESRKFLEKNPKILNLYYGFMWNKLYKREIFANIKNPVGFWFEDMINDLVIFPSFTNVKTNNRITYSYTTNLNGITSTSRYSHKILDSYYVLKEIMDHIDDFKINYTIEHFKRLLFQASYQVYARIRKQEKSTIINCFILLCKLINETIKKYSLKLDGLNEYEKSLVFAFDNHNYLMWKNISHIF